MAVDQSEDHILSLWSWNDDNLITKSNVSTFGQHDITLLFLIHGSFYLITRSCGQSTVPSFVLQGRPLIGKPTFGDNLHRVPF